MTTIKSIEEVKAYNDALSRAKGFYERFPEHRDVIEKIFPQLKENEDEEARQAMIDFFKHEREEGITTLHYGVNIERMIAWLEKQGEQKPTDKVEPKFKVGDWVVCNNGSHPIFQVIECSWPNAKYRNIEGTEIFLNVNTLEKQYHLFTIQDAKDGDVLYMDNGLSTCTFIYKSINNIIIQKYASYNKFGFEGTTYLVLNDGYVCPATKEQRNTLMKAMADAGYTFDFEKKELKKIEQKSWSKEDEKKLNRIYMLLAEAADEHAFSTTCRLIGDKECVDLQDFLKSLMPQSTWKPSEEQIKALSGISVTGCISYAEQGQELINLYQDLKKLKGE